MTREDKEIFANKIYTSICNMDLNRQEFSTNADSTIEIKYESEDDDYQVTFLTKRGKVRTMTFVNFCLPRDYNLEVILQALMRLKI